jgi:integrase
MFGAIVQLIMLTGQRRSEIGGLLERFYSKDQQTVTLPGTLTKNHVEHTFPVGPMAAHIIETRIAVPRGDSQFLFPSRTSSSRPFNGWAKCKKEIDNACQIPHWTLHDLRRTFRTNLGRLRVRPDIAERLVNHVSSRSDMEEIYDLHNYIPEMREAIEMWESHLKSVIKPVYNSNAAEPKPLPVDLGAREIETIR